MTKTLKSEKQLIEIDIQSIPESHPIQIMNSVYKSTFDKVDNHLLPRLSHVMENANSALKDYCLVLQPVVGSWHMDFLVTAKGQSIPGINSSTIAPGELYTQRIEPQFIQERLMELASAIVLKAPKFTRATSARSSTLDLKVFRGIFPVWLQSRQSNAAILLIAQPYAEIR